MTVQHHVQAPAGGSTRARARARAGMLLVPPVLIVVAAFVLYYFEELVRRGRPFDHLDAYGRGFMTWWVDAGTFWGNVELWTAIALFTGAFSAWWRGSPGVPTRAALPLAAGAATIALAMLVLAIAGVPVPVDVAGILASGWYPHYFPSRLLFVLLAFSGAWGFFLGWRTRHGRPGSGKMATGGAVSVLLASLAVVHLTAVSSWDPATIVDVTTLIVSVAGYIGFVIPLAACFTSVLLARERHRGDTTSARDGKAATKGTWKVLAWTGTVAAGLVAVAISIPIVAGADTGIVINAEIIARNLLTWTCAALITAGVHVLACSQGVTSTS